MKTRFMTVWTVAAIAVSLAGCSSTADSSVAAGSESTPVAKSKSTPAAKVENSGGGFRLPWSKPKLVTIALGTPVKVRTDTSLSTKSATTGDSFAATLAEDIVVDGKVVVPSGAQVEGKVVESDDGGRVKGVASISVRLTQLHVGNREVAISTGTLGREARTTKKNDAVKVGIGAGIGAAIGAIAGGGKGAAIGAASGGAAGTGVVLATHGEAAVIPAESLLTFKLTAPVTVDPS